MSVSSVGGAASLPVPLPAPVPPLPAPAGASAEAVPPSGPAGRAPGDVHVPGRPDPAAREAEVAKEEPPKPEPLPPLRGLTVAEFRVMLGIGIPSEAPDDAVPHVSLRAAMDRYA
jgi:hypothetical protein